MKIKILIPVYNDWQSVDRLLENINSEVSNLSHEFSVVIVNDASTEVNPGISNTCALPSGEAALNSIKCFISNSCTSLFSKLPSIDFSIYNKVVR